MAEKIGNRASNVLASPITNSQTTITLVGNIGFPTTQNFRIRVDAELMLVTSGGTGSTTWTVTRGIEGTLAAAHPASSKVTHVLTAGGLKQFLAENYTPL